MPALTSQACTTTEKRQREFLMGNKWTNIFGCKAKSRLVLMGCGFVVYFLTPWLYCVGFVCLTLSFDEVPLFPLKRKKKGGLSKYFSFELQ